MVHKTVKKGRAQGISGNGDATSIISAPTARCIRHATPQILQNPYLVEMGAGRLKSVS